MEPPAKPLMRGGTYAVGQETTEYEQAVSNAVRQYWPILYSAYVFAIEQQGGMDTNTNSLGLFNALSGILAEHMARHCVSAALPAASIKEWKEIAVTAFNLTFDEALQRLQLEHAAKETKQ